MADSFSSFPTTISSVASWMTRRTASRVAKLQGYIVRESGKSVKNETGRDGTSSRSSLLRIVRPTVKSLMKTTAPPPVRRSSSTLQTLRTSTATRTMQADPQTSAVSTNAWYVEEDSVHPISRHSSVQGTSKAATSSLMGNSINPSIDASYSNQWLLSDGKTSPRGHTNHPSVTYSGEVSATSRLDSSSGHSSYPPTQIHTRHTSLKSRLSTPADSRNNRLQTLANDVVNSVSDLWSSVETHSVSPTDATFNATLAANVSMPCTNETWPCDSVVNGSAGGGFQLEERDYWALILVLFPLFTVFGNVLVILSVYKERSLQTATNYFIVSLAIADLLVATLVMPFAVYVLVNGDWGLPPVLCDFYIAMDVTCSTSSIFNLVAISIDRYIAVTQPIKYARHKNHKRVWLTIGLVWAISAAIGLPIVLGLNHTPARDPTLCVFYNSDFVIYSSLSSFYIPCIIMVFLYYKIFKAIRERAQRAVASKKPHTVSDTVGHTKRFAETALGGPPVGTGSTRAANPVTVTATIGSAGGQPNSTATAGILPSAVVKPLLQARVLEDKATDQGSGSQDEEEDAEEPDGWEENNPLPRDNSTELLTNMQVDAISKICLTASAVNGDTNGNQETSYGTSSPHTDGGLSVSPRNDSEPRSKPKTGVRGNGLGPEVIRQDSAMSDTNNGGSGKDNKTSSRFTIYKVNKASRKKREKSSAKKERKATKTLAIVLGVFLICWVPFFTCNIMDAICLKLQWECQPGVTAFLLTTWLGYMNSFINPVIYTIFNLEFRKAFKRILICAD